MAQHVQTQEVSFTITRPADVNAYAINDQVADNVVAGSVTPMRFQVGPNGSACVISHFRLVRSGSTAADFNFSIFTAPVTQYGDNVGFNEPIAEATNRVANVSFWSSINVVAWTGGGFSYWGTVSPAVQQSRLFVPYLADGYLYGSLMAQTAWTPAASETFTIILTVERM